MNPSNDFFFTTEKKIQSQWAGCGAVPGFNLLPAVRCGKTGTCPLRPLVLEGMSSGPNGRDVLTADSTPVNCSPWPMPFMMPDRDAGTDGMDDRVWGLPTSGTVDASDSYLAWTRPRGAWP